MEFCLNHSDQEISNSKWLCHCWASEQELFVCGIISTQSIPFHRTHNKSLSPALESTGVYLSPHYGLVCMTYRKEWEWSTPVGQFSEKSALFNLNESEKWVLTLGRLVGLVSCYGYGESDSCYGAPRELSAWKPLSAGISNSHFSSSSRSSGAETHT